MNESLRYVSKTYVPATIKNEVQRTRFDQSFDHKTTIKSDYLYPLFLKEILPGDTMELNPVIFGRIASPLDVPIMDNIKADMHYFYVPSRILWDNWIRMCGQKDNPDDVNDHVVPVVNSGTGLFSEESIWDYLGLPIGFNNHDINVLPLRAYNKIYNHFYRDQNLIDSIPEETGDGPDSASDYVLRKRGKYADYFTSCLPFTQKGEEIPIPVGGTAPVIGDGSALGLTDNYSPTPYSYALRALNAAPGNVILSGDGFDQDLPYNDASGYDSPRDHQVYGVSENPDHSGLIADLEGAAIVTVNDLREAIAVQQLYELEARSGTRYEELLLATYGVDVPDYRVQHPEYLGGFSKNININPVTANSGSGANLGQLAGYGVFAGQGEQITKSFVEHGFVMGICSIRGDQNYFQGLHRLWSRQDKLDYPWPLLCNIGEQPVLNKELYFDNSPDDELIFGYQPPFEDYRRGLNMITGAFRPSHSLPLEQYHLAEEHATRPELNQTFIESSTPMDRVTTVDTTDGVPTFLLDISYQLFMTRVLPAYGIPGLKRL
jgi:hypothetical protein